MEQTFQLINNSLDKLFVYGPFWIYLALLIALFIENIFPPFPGDFFALTGGALAASGRLNIYMVFLMVYLGGIASVMLVYYFGHRYGRDYFIRKNFRLFSADDIARLEEWFKRRGGYLLLLNRFLIGGRSVIILVAGIGRYNPWLTYIFASISFLIFNGILLFGSYIFVVNIETIITHYRMYEKIVWPIVILIAVALAYWKLKRNASNDK